MSPRLPAGTRAAIGRALDRLGVLDRLFWLKARLGRRGVAVITYHRVGLPGAVGELDPDLVEVEPDELEAQLAVLKTHCTILTIADIRLVAKGRPPPPNPVLVTFDDGYADAHDVALPILRRAGVPATFFIPTAFPDAGRLFWWDRVYLMMRRCRLDRVDLAYPAPLALHPARDPEAAARLVCAEIKRTRRIDLDALWDELEARTGVVIDRAEERSIAARTIMGWKKIEALAGAGMDVQSHSHEHLVLNTLSPEAAERDLRRSRAVLREAVGAEVFGVAYPVGYEIAGPLRRAPADASFELGFTNGTGLCPDVGFDPLNLPRLSMDISLSRAAYKAHVLFGDRDPPAPPFVDVSARAAASPGSPAA